MADERKNDGKEGPEIEITPEMVKAGVDCFYGQGVELSEEEVEAAVAAIFSAMIRAQPK